jgi:NAD(P)-dependent dehydrogenase (short-subunit alcohol dehydrogenase family)
MSVAPVSGASAGNGRQIARRLRATGHEVYAGARRIDELADLAAEGIDTLRMDITAADDVRAMVERATTRIAQQAGMIGSGIGMVAGLAASATYPTANAAVAACQAYPIATIPKAARAVTISPPAAATCARCGEAANPDRRAARRR